MYDIEKNATNLDEAMKEKKAGLMF